LSGRSASSIFAWTISTTRHARSRIASLRAARSSASVGSVSRAGSCDLLCCVAPTCGDGTCATTIARSACAAGVSGVAVTLFESRPPRQPDPVCNASVPSADPVDGVALALANALDAATRAGQWALAASLLDELRARRGGAL